MIYLFGGYNGVNRLNDFYSYNTTLNTWNQIITSDLPPSPR